MSLDTFELWSGNTHYGAQTCKWFSSGGECITRTDIEGRRATRLIHSSTGRSRRTLSAGPPSHPTHWAFLQDGHLVRAHGIYLKGLKSFVLPFASGSSGGKHTARNQTNHKMQWLVYIAILPWSSPRICLRNAPTRLWSETTLIGKKKKKRARSRPILLCPSPHWLHINGL